MGIISDRLSSFLRRKGELEDGGGKELQAAVRSSGRLTARERIEFLLDEGSFVETGVYVKQRATDFNAAEKDTPADGVVTGFGSVQGRLVFVYSQDSTVLGGSVGEMHAKKICGIYEKALKMGAPVVGFADSTGMRVQEGVDALDAYGSIYSAMNGASGVVPQITAVMGGCMGSEAIIPALSDFVFAVEESSRLFLISPNSMEGSADGLGTKAENNPLVHFSCSSDAECIAEIRNLISFLPSNNMEDAPCIISETDLNRTEEALNAVVPEDLETAIDIRGVIGSLADGGVFVEVYKKYAGDAVEGFIRMNGQTVGVIANNGDICPFVVNKIRRFAAFCDSFNIPMLTLTDAGGYKTQASQAELISASASLISIFASATVPKVNVIIRKGFGNAYVAMNSKHIGADMVFAWPYAQVAAMEPEAAVRVMYGEEEGTIAAKLEEYKIKASSPYVAAGRGFIDDVIEPAATRKRVIAALEMLAAKRESGPAKKHSGFVL